MDETPLVVAVCGSRSDDSNTRKALRHVLRAAAEAGAETELVDLGAVDLPLFDPDDRDVGDAAELKALMEEADAVALGTPVYHGSYSSALKNFHDYCGSDQYEDTVVGLLAVAGGSTFSSTLDHLGSTVRNVHGYVIPEQVGIPSVYDKFDDDGEFTDEDVEERVYDFGEALVDRAQWWLSPPGEASGVEAEADDD